MVDTFTFCFLSLLSDNTWQECLQNLVQKMLHQFSSAYDNPVKITHGIWDNILWLRFYLSYHFLPKEELVAFRIKPSDKSRNLLLSFSISIIFLVDKVTIACNPFGVWMNLWCMTAYSFSLCFFITIYASASCLRAFSLSESCSSMSKIEHKVSL